MTISSSWLTEINYLGFHPKSARAVTNVNHSNQKPEPTSNLGQDIEVPPNDRTEDKPEQRQESVTQNVPPTPFTIDHAELPEHREVHAHESEEGTEV
jgi:hypothetical protein